MGFHKLTFPIYLIPEVTERGWNRYEVITGWTDETYSFGFHKASNGKTWIATDLNSGLRITKKLTRKECAEWITENMDKITAAKQGEQYKIYAEEFKKLRKEVGI